MTRPRVIIAGAAFRRLLGALVLGLGLASGCNNYPHNQPYAWPLPPGVPIPRVPANNPMNQAKVELGRHLFFDTRLSLNQTQSCGSCHDPARSFTDGQAVSTGSTGDHTPRNAMAVVNVAYNFTQTWANPALRHLEDQALNPIFGERPVELGFSGREDILLERLRHELMYPPMFRAAFGGNGDISMPNVVRAIAAFERSLLSFNAPVDRFDRGERSALSESAQRGRVLYNSERTECFHCHGGFNYSGEVDHQGNLLAEQEYENNALYNIDGRGGYPSPNRGLFEATHEPTDMGRFKPPSLRNIALTAPYMHDGSIATLEEVVAHYARGGRLIESGPNAGDGHESPLRSQFLHGFTLTEQERLDLLAFLHALTDTDFVNAPEHQNPFRSRP